MRKKSFFYFAAAALSLTFAACSQDDLTSNADVITPDMETSYAKVKISMGSNFGTRAFNDDEKFDRGTKEEAEVKNLMLVLYDAEGKVVGTGTANDFTTDENRTTGPAQSVSDAYKSTIVKFKLNVGSKTPTKLLAYVNTTSTDETTLASAIGNTKDGFVMTNSGYYAQENANSWTIATTISDEDLYDTEAEARAAGEDNTVNIYVERLAAKVTALKAEGLDSKTTADVIIKGVDDQEYKIVFNAKKWAVTGLAKEMYTLKQQFDYSLAGWANNSNFSRSYWAKGVNYDTQYGAYATSDNPLTYLSLSQIVSKKGGIGYELGQGVEYVPEHTIGEKAINGDAFDGTLTSTSLVVVGKYTVQAVSADGNAENYKANDESGNYQFYLSLTGTQDGKDVYTIYNQTDMIKELIDRSGLTLSTSDASKVELEDSKLSTYFTVVTNKEENSVELEYKGSGLYYQKDGTWETLTQEQIKNATAKAKMYYNGWAYFWGPITHNTEVTNQKVGYYGVVRNHSYQITINSFAGLGAPLDEKEVGGDDPEEEDPDPDNPIIPNPDDIKDAYINATLNVLSWHNIAYGVNF